MHGACGDAHMGAMATQQPGDNNDILSDNNDNLSSRVTWMTEFSVTLKQCPELQSYALSEKKLLTACPACLFMA